jgi:ABC-type antimicrobial peptide transport system permease subunit
MGVILLLSMLHLSLPVATLNTHWPNRTARRQFQPTQQAKTLSTRLKVSCVSSIPYRTSNGAFATCQLLIKSTILSAILSAILSTILSAILPAILSAILPAILSVLLSAILLATQLAISLLPYLLSLHGRSIQPYVARLRQTVTGQAHVLCHAPSPGYQSPL